MGGKSGPSPPPAPDPKETAAAQLGLNVQTARINAAQNRVNQITPYGSLTYARNPMQFGGGAPPPVAAPVSTERRGRWVDEQYDAGGGDGGGTTQIRKVFVDDPNGDATQPALAGTAPSAPALDGYDPNQDEGWTATVSLDPAQQALLDQSNAFKAKYAGIAANQVGRVKDMLSSPFDLAGIPDAGPSGFDVKGSDQGTAVSYKPIGYVGDVQSTYAPADGFSADRQRVEDALMARLNPSLERQREAMEIRLANQGINNQNEAYRGAADETNRIATDARLAAILSAGQEQSRMLGEARSAGAFANQAQAQQFGQGMDRANLNNAVNQQVYGRQVTNANLANANRQRAMQERLLMRQTPINELAALTSGSAVTNPQFINAPQVSVAAPDYQGAVSDKHRADMAAWQADSQRSSSGMGQLAGLVGTGLMAWGTGGFGLPAFLGGSGGAAAAAGGGGMAGMLAPAVMQQAMSFGAKR